MITLLGIGHVFDIRKGVEHAIISRRPDIVCVELDRVRYQALLDRTSKRSAPLVYKMLAAFQQRIARKYGSGVGQEMITAIETAKKINAEVAFIDMDASIVFAKIWRAMSLKEKVKFIVGAFAGLFVGKETVEKELKRFEERSDVYLEMFGNEFPTVKEVLIDERDRYMADAIRKLSARYENIIAVIGDGHIHGVVNLLDDLRPEVIRLSELRSFGTVTYSFTLEYEGS